MTYHAYFDSNAAAPAPVLGWYNTDFATYPNLPAPSNLLAMTQAQWDDRMTGLWAVSSGALVAYTPPTPVLTLAEQAGAAMMAGLTISLSGSMTLAPTVFPTDPVTQTKLDAVSTVVLKTSAFPGGATTYPMKDAAGLWHPFTISQYEAVALAISAYVAPLDLIIDGNPLNATALPPNSVSLTV